ncbi:hypothetical protein OG920_46130 [Streptomyces europaeiscabiei]|uniref:hypothetical protein n=1 Tax=Streptomyces europaeiscabiei TaxID=146819 RepID=UPI0029AE7D70|nr:hypothetical protein [Streptomyces europaeiscabiei]MDX3589368.1 hypothetical protein [Streptomyces europaeiscabiei]MDX3615952.1 hypothetical protein [Streptomyces europaeiscabiei]MDX3637406.1 hypothetical protein [Streptomyces europaeiscabiei]MDX3652979.1 hypothetical protein [Streptomyces europaeiscabiei]
MAAAGDGLGLVSSGERHYGDHGRQCHEQTEYGFTHFLPCSPESGAASIGH